MSRAASVSGPAIPAVASVVARSKRQRKKARILMSLAGLMLGFLVAPIFVLAGYWSFSFAAWGWLLTTAVLIHAALWMMLHLRWDALFTWDRHFLYIPWACFAALLCTLILVVPEARVLFPFAFFINLMFLVGLVGMRDVVVFSLVMSGGYLAAMVTLRAWGEPIEVGYEALISVLLLVLGGFSASVLDQARQRRYLALQDSAELRKLSQAVQQSSSLVVITDVEGRIEYVNPKFTESTGYLPEEVVGETPAILRSEETSEQTYNDLWCAITSGNEWHGEFKNKKKNGDAIWVIASISPIRDRKGVITHFLGVQEDVTERREVEAQLQQAQKLEGLGRLVSGVAHDFNNLLTGVLGFTELALTRVDFGSAIHEDLLEVQKAGTSASALTRQLLAFSRQQMLRPVILDLNQVVNEVEVLLRRTVTEEVEVALELAADLSLTRADRVQIQQILMNLAINARDAMPEGGWLLVETANAELGSRFGDEVVAVKPGRYVMLRVTDTGCGMDEDTRARVFEPFFTTKERGHGTGLGLATVYGIVKQSRGYIWVTSELGKGTSFEIYLPRNEGEIERPVVVRAERAPVSGPSTETVLLVEDDDSVRRLASRALASRGYLVLTADGPVEAQSLIREHDIDLLITDVVMPGLNGVQLAERFKESQPDAQVLLMSGYAEEGVIGSRLADPGTPFLSKPFRIEEFLSTVKRLLDGAEPPALARVAGLEPL